MSIEENKFLATRVMEEIFSRGDLNSMSELFAPDMVVHDPDKELQGREQAQLGILRLRAAFPDLHYTVLDQIAEGDKVVNRFQGRGTHLGEFRGHPPTQKEMVYTGIVILRFSEGQVIEHWGVSDVLGMFQQLGLIKPPTQPG